MTRWPKSVISAALAFGLLLIIGLGSGLFYPVFAGGPYKGRVIDSETKQWLEGAAVLAVWESVTPTAEATGLPPAYTNPAGSGVVSITSVTEGAVINDFSVLVRGLVDVPFRTEVGVTVNGFVAFVDKAQFAVEVPADNSVTGLTAVARDAMGVTLGSQTIPVTVQLPTTEPILILLPSRSIGSAPLTVSFELGSLEPISRIDLDAYGNGTVDFQGTTLDNQQFIYEGPGLYFPKVTVTDTANKIYTKTAILLVVAQNELEILLQSKWTALKNALRAGNISSALNYIAISKRAYYGKIFSSFTVPIDEVLTDITFIEMAWATAECQMVREDPEGRTAYMVRFVIDEDGIWRIGDF